jgi:hypothetical protein
VNATVASETPSKAAAAVSGAVGWAWWVVKALIGGLLIAWALAWAWQFPVYKFELMIGLAIYAALLIWRPSLWLVVVPAALPVLELTYWSGRVFWNEFDMLLLVSVGGCLFRKGVGVDRLGLSLAGATVVLLFYNLFVTINGSFPIVEAGLGHGIDYLSSSNALREAKGFIYALALLPVLALENSRGTDIRKYLTAGMVAGLIFAGGTIVWERGLFTGVFDFNHPYRVSGWFFAMHVGGAPLDAFLALATPFVVAAFFLWRNIAVRLFMLAVAGLAIYAFYVTYSRANYPAVLGMAAVFALGLTVAGKLSVERFREIPVIGTMPIKQLAIIGIVGFVVMLGGIKWLVGDAIVDRFSTLSRDFGIRFTHWSDSAALVPDNLGGNLIGIGRGLFPRAYLENSPTRGEHLTTAEFLEKDGDGIVRFNTSDANGALFLRQRFDRESAKIVTLSIRMRPVTTQRERLLVEFCERHILKFLKECRWVGINLDPGDDWKTYSLDLDLYSLGARSFGPFSVPIEISVINRGIKKGVDMTEIGLVDKATGRQMLKNTGFGQGMDHWFVSYGNHLRWHIKNIFVYLYVEGGYLALLLFAGLSGLIAVKLLRRILMGDIFAVSLAACCVGVVFVGLFDSIFDDPKIGLLTYVIAWMALLPTTVEAGASAPAAAKTASEPLAPKARRREEQPEAELEAAPEPQPESQPEPAEVVATEETSRASDQSETGGARVRRRKVHRKKAAPRGRHDDDTPPEERSFLRKPPKK